MHWLNPFGWLALLLAVPIILLYFLRLYRQEAVVPSLLLWEAVLADRRANRPWQKLRRNWLLFLQLLALLALVVALARPALPVPLALRGQVLVLLDVSASMQARHADHPTRLDAAKAELRRLADTLSTNDRVTLITVGPALDVLLPEGDLAAFRRALDTVTPTDGPADWGAAAALASGLAAGDDITTLLVTDAASAAPFPALPGDVRLVFVGGEQANTGIVALALRRSTEGLAAFVRVRNYGPPTARALSIYAEGVFIERRELALPADGEASLVISDLPALAWLEARLDSDDALPLDDRAWVALPAEAGGHVLLLTPGNRFLAQALRGLPALQVTQAVAPPPAADTYAYGLLVADGPITGTLPALNQWLIAPGAGTLCGEPGAVFTPTATARGQWGHPLLEYVEWSEVHIARARRYTPPPDATVLIETAAGPLLWLVERPGQRVACQAFALRDSDLPLRLAFPILTANLVGWLLPEASAEPVTPLPAGQFWSPTLPPDAEDVVIITPSGVRLPLTPRAVLPTRAGLYRLEANTAAGRFTRYAALALLDDAESDLAPRPLTVGGQVLPTTSELAPGYRELTRWPLLVALLLLLLEAWVWWRPRLWPVRRPARLKGDVALALRFLLLLTLLLALLDVRWTRRTRELAVVFLLDRSASTQAAWENDLAFVREALAAKAPGDRAALVVFGADAWVDRALSPLPELAPLATFPRVHATNIEEALRLGLALIPADAPGRLVLLSDGLETVGRARQTLGEAGARGVDFVVVSGGAALPPGEVWLAELRLPTRVYPGDTIPLAAVVGADRAQAAALTWAVGGDAGQQALALQPGESAFAFSARAGEPGFMPLRVCVAAAADTFPQNNCADGWVRVEGAPQVLVVGDPDERSALVAALSASGLEVVAVDPEAMPATAQSLVPYASVVLVNTPARRLPDNALTALQTFVRDLGGGLIAIGGPSSYGVGGWLRTPLEEALPVSMLLEDPQRFPPMMMVIVIDKSGSMGATEGGKTKIRLAAEAAVRVAEGLNDADILAVVAFDDRPADTIGPASLTERETLIAQTLRLQPGGGGIYMYDSTVYAEQLFLQVDPAPGMLRHILMLADGADAEQQAGVLALTERLQSEGYTVSVVAIGEGQDVPFLEQMAEAGNGRFYLTRQAADLPDIFGEEVLRAKRSYIVEEPFYPQPVTRWDPVAGLSATPPLQGYVAAAAKPGAQVVWQTAQDDPLLAAWQYGLGRSVAWTSDARARWAAGWVAWEDFSRFWGSVARWSLAAPADEGLALRVEPRGEQARVVVDALTPDGDYADGLQLGLRVSDFTGELAPQDIVLHQTASGRYEGEFALAGQRGLLLNLTGERRFATGWSPPPPAEYLPGDADAALAQLVTHGQGRLETDPAATFARTLRGRRLGDPLAPWLALAVALLWPVDIAWRRLSLTGAGVARVVGRWGARLWVGLRVRWPRRRRSRATPSSEPSLAARVRARAGQSQPPPPMAPGDALSPPMPPETEPVILQPQPKPAPPPAASPSASDEGEDTLASRLRRRLKE